jgi:cation:H+ antiporter
VGKTEYFAGFFHISAYFISLIVIALGTDLPELSLAVRSTLSGKKDIAMGDYIGAAAASTLFFGIFTLLHNGEVLTIRSFGVTFSFILIALLLFFIFAVFNERLSRRNAFVMVALYFLFLFIEISRS